MVRQLLIQYFVQVKHFPVSRMSVERKLSVHGLARRYDLVLFDRNPHPLLLAECKAPLVPISQDVLDQAARYNIELKVPYLFVTNGRHSYCCSIDFMAESWEFLEQMPELK
jgi:type I site-specific restriction endonuclease